MGIKCFQAIVNAKFLKRYKTRCPHTSPLAQTEKNYKGGFLAPYTQIQPEVPRLVMSMVSSPRSPSSANNERAMRLP